MAAYVTVTNTGATPATVAGATVPARSAMELRDDLLPRDMNEELAAVVRSLVAYAGLTGTVTVQPGRLA